MSWRCAESILFTLGGKEEHRDAFRFLFTLGGTLKARNFLGIPRKILGKNPGFPRKPSNFENSENVQKSEESSDFWGSENS